MTVSFRVLAVALGLALVPSAALADPFVTELNATDRDYLTQIASFNEGQIRAANLVNQRSDSPLARNLASQVIRTASPASKDFALYASGVKMSLPEEPQGDTATELAALKGKSGHDLDAAYIAFVKSQTANAVQLATQEVRSGHQSDIVTLANHNVADWRYLNDLASRDDDAESDPTKMGELAPRS